MERWHFAADLPGDWYGAQASSIGRLGIYGQALCVHPASRIVIARHPPQATPLDFELDAMQLAALAAIAAAFG